MPATNPRLTITLKPSTAAIMRTLSELTGNSQSALIAELLEANEETFSRLITVLSAAQQAKVALTEEMSAGLQQAQDKLEKQLGLALEAVDSGMAPILAAAEKVQRRGARRGGGSTRVAGRSAVSKGRGEGDSTPMSNRGVRLTTKQAKTSSKSRG